MKKHTLLTIIAGVLIAGSLIAYAQCVDGSASDQGANWGCYTGCSCSVQYFSLDTDGEFGAYEATCKSCGISFNLGCRPISPSQHYSSTIYAWLISGTCENNNCTNETWSDYEPITNAVKYETLGAGCGTQ